MAGRPQLSDIPALDYQRDLFRERTLTSVTANTRADGEELFRLAVALGITPQVEGRPLDEVNAVPDHVAGGDVSGALVLTVAD